MRLMLTRHGKTFEPDETPRFIGAGEDIPLTQEGQAQADHVAEYMIRHEVRPVAIYVSPLIRAKRFGDLIAEAINYYIPVIIDQRLTEINYGKWANKTDQEIIEEFGEEPLRSWREEGVWPEGMGWHPNEQTIINQVENMAENLSKFYQENDTVILVSSNGVLRYFLTLIPGQFDKHQWRQDFKVRTGHLCQLQLEKNNFKKNFWNINPGEYLT